MCVSMWWKEGREGERKIGKENKWKEGSLDGEKVGR